MKKTSLLTTVLLLLVVTLSATPNWVSFQALSWASEQTVTAGFLGFSSSASVQESGQGLKILGTYYTGQDSLYGLGFQFGATALHERTVDGTKFVTSPSDTVTWRGGVTGQYRADISTFLGLELGAGLLYELTKDTVSNDRNPTITTNIYSLLTSANLLVNLTEKFSFIGGIEVSFPFMSSAKLTAGSVSTEPTFEVKGHTTQIQAGVAFRI